jgi:hypothetical protein
MTYSDGNRPNLWGSRANGPVGWIVSVVCVLMLIVAVYLYAVREDVSAPGRPPNATSGSSNSARQAISTTA